MYEIFEHTADLGIRVSAEDLNTLFIDAGKALFSVIVENVNEVHNEQERVFEIAGSDKEYLFFDWLSELLSLFEIEHLLCSEFEVTVSETGLKAKVRGEPVDLQRHLLSHEVKAVTYHRLRVEQTSRGWEAEVILDI
ncbi:MAG: archease [Planctomycetes bacterium]|nr:archease [Planctomycetota bacterium]